MAVLLLGFMFSCDNTTSNPINNNINNPSTGTGGSGSTGTTITGPRILHKITANNEITQEFVTTGGILEKAIYREDSGPNSFLIAVVTYTSGKITKVKVDQQVNGTTPANNIAYNFDITYDSGGKINSTIGNTSIGTTAGFTSEYAYTYDSAGKMTKIVEKKKIGADYSQYTNYNFTNTGDNITKVVTETGPTTSAGVPTSTVLMTTTYNYTSYDNKINPYTTLPKTFFVIWSLMHPLNFPLLSVNNVTNYNVQYNGTPMVSPNFTYLYDSMNYPISDQTQTQKYIYKAL
ncbi:hypothetical protein K0U91_05145 [Chryseobacterium chendengshani]|uniref:hypothetical protein n=1 Tax=Chryseobacterium sp. LJ668 TaxID=2864040 RepID=UPI001C68DF9A|nr:hypothetical protein [Chryseobacterium sp. LJ668]MBW8521852.1 hypothetical protein [Chryseobacterium sp. LJ668]QYK17511.1 hypothetical protein K0U91_05145 [Chryseobacterium sp. LJ668]